MTVPSARSGRNGERVMSDNTKAARDVARAYELTKGRGINERKELFNIIRRCIAGLPPEEADKALGELLHEIEVCEQIVFEEAYGADFSNYHSKSGDTW